MRPTTHTWQSGPARAGTAPAVPGPRSTALRILMDAGPWLPVPPRGYGGLENVVATLTTELRRRGHEVVLATVGESTLPADGRIVPFPTQQFHRLPAPYPEGTRLPHPHPHARVRGIPRAASPRVPV